MIIAPKPGLGSTIKRRPVDPFDVLSEDEILEKLARSRTHAAQGRSRDAEAVISDMRAKIKRSTHNLFNSTGQMR